MRLLGEVIPSPFLRLKIRKAVRELRTSVFNLNSTLQKKVVIFYKSCYSILLTA
jgi:hypothetical protein